MKLVVLYWKDRFSKKKLDAGYTKIAGNLMLTASHAFFKSSFVIWTLDSNQNSRTYTEIKSLAFEKEGQYCASGYKQ